MISEYMKQRLAQKNGQAKTSQQERAEKKSVPIPKKSAKRKVEDKEYSKEAKAYLAAHPVCEAQCVEGCKGKSSEIHHKRKRNSKDDRINPANFLATCRPCHLFIESHPKQAKELGLSESHLKPKK